MANIAGRAGANIGNMLAARGGETTQMNPMTMMLDAARIGQIRQATQLQGLEMQARSELGTIVATTPPDQLQQAVMRSPWVTYFPEFMTSLAQTNNLVAQTEGRHLEMTGNIMSDAMKSLTEMKADPTLGRFENIRERVLAATPASVRDQVAHKLDGMRSAIFDNTGGGKDYDVIQQHLDGLIMHAGLPAEGMAAAIGEPGLIQQGSTVQPGWRGGVTEGGRFYPSGPGLPVGSPGGYHDIGGIPVPSPAVTGTGQPIGPQAGQPSQPGTPGQPGGATGQPGTTGPQIPTGQIQQLNWTQKSLESIGKHQDELNERISTGGALMQQIAEVRGLLRQVKTGPQQAWRQPLSLLASQIGMSDDIVNKIAGGDLNAVQELQKHFATITMGQISQSMPHGSHLNLPEWSAFQRGTPSMIMQNDAVERIANFWERQYNYWKDESSQLADYMRGGGDPAKWASEWSERARKLGYYSIPKSRSLEDIQKGMGQ